MIDNKTQNFKKKAELVHEGKYDYSRTTYVKASIKVNIGCPVHTEFSQTPNNHLRGKGCPDCGKEVRRLKTTKNTTWFIQEAKRIHGNKYNYSRAVYKLGKEKIYIECPSHGFFEQTPDKHITGQGCPKCARLNSGSSQRLTLEEFISSSDAIHKGKFDYSKCLYVNSKTDVIIGCPLHGEFKQTPSIHQSSEGCPDCGRDAAIKNKTKTLVWFLDKCQQAHGDFYDYSLVDYKLIKTKVTILCRLHGAFEQSPDKHIQGQGCPKCKPLKIANHNRKDTAYFINKAVLFHGSLYDYSKTEYVSAKEKVIIICDKHGEFLQTPDGHISGSGCLKCAGKHGITTAEFVEKAQLVHGSKYNYGEAHYIAAKNRVKIICPIHGFFKQTPDNHLNGAECKECAVLKKHLVSTLDSNLGEEALSCYYIKFQSKGEVFWKVGVTKRNIAKRFRADYLAIDQTDIIASQEEITTSHKALLFEVYWMFKGISYSGRFNKYLELTGGVTETFTVDISHGLSLAEMIKEAWEQWGSYSAEQLKRMTFKDWHIRQKVRS
jgi:hypothetical protein